MGFWHYRGLLALCLSLLGLHLIVPGGIVRAGGEHHTMETARGTLKDEKKSWRKEGGVYLFFPSPQQSEVPAESHSREQP